MIDNRIDDLKELGREIEKNKEELIKGMISDTGTTFKHANVELNLAVNALKTFDEDEIVVINRDSLGEVGLVLPYNAAGVLFAISVGGAYLPGNKLRVKLSSKSTQTSRFLESLIKNTLSDVQIEYVKGEKFITECLLDTKIKGLQVYGHDSWARKYIDMVKSTKTKFVFEGPGNCPLLVLSDANIRDAVKGAVASGIKLNSGQICMSSERFYVHEEILENFLEEILKEIESLKVGDPRDEKTDVGPLGSVRVAANIKSQIEDAVNKGAKVEMGNRAEVFRLDGLKTYLVYPTVLTNVNHSMMIMQEETFGPVIPIQTFKEEKEVVMLANDNRYGLSAVIYGNNTFNVANKLRFTHGLVLENKTVTNGFDPHQPWGGFKDSGWIWEWQGNDFKIRDGPKLFSIEFSRGK